MTEQRKRDHAFRFNCVFCGHDMFYHFQGYGFCQHICVCDEFAAANYFDLKFFPKEPAD